VTLGGISSFSSSSTSVPTQQPGGGGSTFQSGMLPSACWNSRKAALLADSPAGKPMQQALVRALHRAAWACCRVQCNLLLNGPVLSNGKESFLLSDCHSCLSPAPSSCFHSFSNGLFWPVSMIGWI
jgi:hypothetical protein